MINRTILKDVEEALAVFPVVYLKVLILNPLKNSHGTEIKNGPGLYTEDQIKIFTHSCTQKIKFICSQSFTHK